MSQRQDGQQKTEKATPKRLRDARQQGDVSKSRDLSSTVGLAFAITVLWLTFTAQLERVSEFLSASLSVPAEPFRVALESFGSQALELFLTLSALILIPIAVFGLLLEFIQTGPVMTLKKLKPSMSNLNAGSGLKKMFSLDSLVESLLAIVKTLVLITISWLVIKHFVGQLVLLPGGDPMHSAQAALMMLSRVLLWTVGIFSVIMLFDVAYRRHAFQKKMRMSLREIKEEQRSTEGDPMIKSQRKQLHQDFTETDNSQAARSATALIVNPTHIAIAIHYDNNQIPVPVIAAKGLDSTAQQMRDAANENHVPVLRNEQLARTLHANSEEGSLVPRQLFDVIAEIILWANNTSAIVAQQMGQLPTGNEPVIPLKPPGENLTVYPAGRFEQESSLEPATIVGASVTKPFSKPVV